MPETVQNIFATRKVKLHRLLDKTLPKKTYQHMRKEFITPQIVLKMLRQENETVAARAA
jgi:hypothetical protein